MPRKAPDAPNVHADLITAATITAENIAAGSVTAKRFIVTDDRDRPRIALGISDDEHQEPRIGLFDKNGIRRLALVATEEGAAGVFVYDSEGRERISIVIRPDDVALVMLNDDGATVDSPKARVGLSATNDGGAVFFRDQQGYPEEVISTVDGVVHHGAYPAFPSNPEIPEGGEPNGT